MCIVEDARQHEIVKGLNVLGCLWLIIICAHCHYFYPVQVKEYRLLPAIAALFLIHFVLHHALVKRPVLALKVNRIVVGFPTENVQVARVPSLIHEAAGR